VTVIEAQNLVRSWPADRSVPARLSAAITSAKGVERQQMQMLVEALYVASVTDADTRLLQKYFA